MKAFFNKFFVALGAFIAVKGADYCKTALIVASAVAAICLIPYGVGVAVAVVLVGWAAYEYHDHLLALTAARNPIYMTTTTSSSPGQTFEAPATPPAPSAAAPAQVAASDTAPVGPGVAG